MKISATISAAFLWAASAIPTDTHLKQEIVPLALVSLPQPMTNVIGKFLNLEETSRFSAVKSGNIFSENLQLSYIFRYHASLGENLIRYCTGDATDFNSALGNIRIVTTYINFKLSKITGDNMLERLADFKNAAYFYSRLTRDMLKCSTKLNSYEIAKLRFKMAKIVDYKAHHYSFDGFALEEPTEEELRSSIKPLQFGPQEEERERLVLNMMVDMLPYPLHLKFFSDHFMTHEWNGSVKGKHEMLGILNFVYSQIISGNQVSALLSAKRPLTTSVFSTIFYSTVARKFANIKKPVDDVTKIPRLANIRREFFKINGDFLDYGPAAFAYMFARQRTEWIRNINDLRLIATNGGIYDEKLDSPEILYESAKNVLLNCFNDEKCNPGKDVTAKVLVEIFCLPPHLSQKVVNSILETDHFWDRELRYIGAILA